MKPVTQQMPGRVLLMQPASHTAHCLLWHIQVGDHQGWLDVVQQRRQDTAEGQLATDSTRANHVCSILDDLHMALNGPQL